MFDAQKILQQVLSAQQGQKSKGMINSDHVTGGAIGGLAGLFLGSRSKKSKFGGSVAQMGGIAAVGTLAYQAWQAWQAKQGAQTPSLPGTAEGTVFLPQNPVMRNDLSLTILSAMIAAAKADGHIDATEQDRIFNRIESSDLSAEEKSQLMDQFRRPLTIPDLAAMATSPEVATEIYTASVLAMEPDTTAETSYLSRLASALKLDPGLRKNIEAVVQAA
jgi:uncharacterized membrane protein YebE (DUF533 family)